MVASKMDSMSTLCVPTAIAMALVAFLAGVSYFYIYYKDKHSYWARKGIKGPKPIWFFGNLLDIFGRPIQDVLYENYKTFGKVYGRYELTKPFLIISDSDLIRQLFVKDFHVFINRRDFGDMLGETMNNMVALQRDEDWKRVRNVLSPTFTSGKMKQMFNLMDECTTDAIEHLSNNCEDVDLRNLFQKFALEVIAKCCFATSPDSYNNPKSKFFINATNVFQPIKLNFLAVLVLPHFLGKYLSVFPTEPLEFFEEVVKHLIKERKENGVRMNDFLQILIDIQEGNEQHLRDEGHEDDNDGHHGYEDIEDVRNLQGLTAAKSHKTLDNKELFANAMQFIAAGSETTATLATFVFYHLALDQGVQRTLFEEVSAAETMDYSTVLSLMYLDAVIQEALRMYPPLVVIDREASQDYTLPGLDVTISKGTIVHVPVNNVHRDPENFPEPEVFGPARFLPENRHKIKPYTYLPFGVGPRNCIGMRFALLEAKLLIARLVLELRAVRCDKTSAPVFKAGTPILAWDPLYVSFERRT